MKVKIIITACLLTLVASPAFCESYYPGRDDRKRSLPKDQKLPYHMMLYEQAESAAEDQYSTIVEPKDAETMKQETVTEEAGKPEGSSE